MNRSAIIFFSIFYVSFHLYVGVSGIRKWPLTDYPMFADSYRKDDIISVYSYWVRTSDGKVEKLNRTFGSGFGSTEWNVSKLVKNRNYSQLKSYFSQWIKSQDIYFEFKELIIKKQSASIPSRGKLFEKKEEVVFSLSKEDLE